MSPLSGLQHDAACAIGFGCAAGGRNFPVGEQRKYALICSVLRPDALAHRSPLSRVISGLVRLVRMGAGSNAQCNQHNNTDPDNQHGKRNRIIIEPVPTLYTHDATSPEIAEAAIAAAPWAAFRGSA
jgi:hypothetical protein